MGESVFKFNYYLQYVCLFADHVFWTMLSYNDANLDFLFLHTPLSGLFYFIGSLVILRVKSSGFESEKKLQIKSQRTQFRLIFGTEETYIIIHF